MIPKPKTIYFFFLMFVLLALKLFDAPETTVNAVFFPGFIVYVVFFVILPYRKSSIGLHLLETGQYDAAVEHYSKWGARVGEPHNWMQLFNIAVALHRMGDLKAAIEALDKINPENVPKHIVPQYYALYARTLIMAGTNFDRAEEFHRHALGDGEEVPPELGHVLLYQCHQACLTNDLTLARSLAAQFTEVVQNPKSKRVRNLRRDLKYATVVESYLLGHFDYKVGNFSDAQKLLQCAAEYPYVDLYSTRARELLESMRTNAVYKNEK